MKRLMRAAAGCAVASSLAFGATGAAFAADAPLVTTSAGVSAPAPAPTQATAVGRELVEPGADVRVHRVDGATIDGMVLGLLPDGGFALDVADREVHFRWADVKSVEKAPAPIAATEPAKAAPTLPPQPVSRPIRHFAETGSFEAGLGLAGTTGSVRTEVDFFGTATSPHDGFGTQMFLGYFSADGMEWIAQVALRPAATDFRHDGHPGAGGWAASAGAAYLFEIRGALRAGPEIRAGGQMRSRRAPDGNGVIVNINEQGPEGAIGVRGALPVSNSAVLTAGAAYYVDTFSMDIGQGFNRMSGSGTDQGLQGTLGLSFSF